MGTHQLIYLRTDGNKNIASGHLTRCLSLALACRQLGMDVHFLVSDEESLSLLQSIWESWAKTEEKIREPFTLQTAFAVTKLKTASYDCLEKELPELTALLSAPVCGAFSSANASSENDICVTSKRPVLLIDSYYVTEAYLSALKPFAAIAYLDDLRLFDYPVDLLVNYDVIPKSELPAYRAACQNAGRLLLGAAYTPLRSQFQGKQITIKKHVGNILITTGGSDPYHFCLSFIHKLKILNSENPRIFSDTVFHIIIGKLNDDKDALYARARELPFLKLHENVSDMAALMLGCDFAVSAAGTTLYELCALGVPSVSFTMADNQTASAKAFADAGAIPFAGDIRENPDEVLAMILGLIKDFHDGNSYHRRKSAQTAMRRLVDGSGALRIAQALKALSEG